MPATAPSTTLGSVPAFRQSAPSPICPTKLGRLLLADARRAAAAARGLSGLGGIAVCRALSAASSGGEPALLRAVPNVIWKRAEGGLARSRAKAARPACRPERPPRLPGGHGVCQHLATSARTQSTPRTCTNFNRPHAEKKKNACKSRAGGLSKACSWIAVAGLGPILGLHGETQLDIACPRHRQLAHLPCPAPAPQQCPASVPVHAHLSFSLPRHCPTHRRACVASQPGPAASSPPFPAAR